MAKSPTYKLEVPASTDQLSVARDFVCDHARSFGFGPAEVEGIRLAVDEAMTNVIKHAYKFDDSKTVYINVGMRSNEFWVAIQDTGDTFRIENYQEPDVEQRIKDRKKGGVGVYLIRKLMDKVEYSQKNAHNEIKMIKKR